MLEPTNKYKNNICEFWLKIGDDTIEVYVNLTKRSFQICGYLRVIKQGHEQWKL